MLSHRTIFKFHPFLIFLTLAFCSLFWASSAFAQSLSSVSLSPSTVIGAVYSTGTVTLSAAAPAGGLTVSLTSTSSTVASVPATVLVASGTTTQTFTITTTAVSAQATPTISAIYSGVTKTAVLTVNPAVLTGFSVSPANTTGGTNVTIMVFLNGKAPTGGAVVSLSSTNAGATTLPASITVAASTTSISQVIGTSTVNYVTNYSLSATYQGVTLNAGMALNPVNLRVYDIQMPDTLRFTWSPVAGTTILKRDGTTIATPASGATLYDDYFGSGFTAGHAYLYQLYTSDGVTQLSAEKVSPNEVQASEDQAVDSRLDPRYSTNVFLDFLFGSKTYRGGLFAGFANDPARVGRSYAKFTLPTPPSVSFYRAGNVSAYFTGAVNGSSGTTNMTVGCERISNSDWTASTLKWSTALPIAFNPTIAPATAAISYNPSSPAFGWMTWGLDSDILTVLNRILLGGDARMSVQWASMNESSAGWAYFAKKEYDSTKAPTVLYALDTPVAVDAIFSPSNSIVGGGTVTLNIDINGVGINDTAPVSVTITPRNMMAPYSPVTTYYSVSFPGYSAGLSNAPSTFSVNVTGLNHIMTLGVSTPNGGCNMPGCMAYSGPGGTLTVAVTCGSLTVTRVLTISGAFGSCQGVTGCGK